MKINLFNQHASQQKGVDFLQKQLLHHIKLVGQHTVGRAHIKLAAADFFDSTAARQIFAHNLRPSAFQIMLQIGQLDFRRYISLFIGTARIKQTADNLLRSL